MCKKAVGNCSALDSAPWDVNSPLPKQDWFDPQIDLFVESLNLIAKGLKTDSIEKLEEIRNQDLQAWMHHHAQNVSTWRVRGNQPEKIKSVRKSVSAGLFRAMYQRDNFHCRYCGVKVFPQELFRKFHRLVGEAFPIKGGNLQRHGIKMCFSATYDHVFPHSLGGSDSLDNLVTACWCCNYGKADFTLEQLGLSDPIEIKGNESWKKEIAQFLTELT